MENMFYLGLIDKPSKNDEYQTFMISIANVDTNIKPTKTKPIELSDIQYYSLLTFPLITEQLQQEEFTNLYRNSKTIFKPLQLHLSVGGSFQPIEIYHNYIVACQIEAENQHGTSLFSLSLSFSLSTSSYFLQIEKKILIK